MISAIILAGGKAKRFGGVDKGLLKLNNVPLIEHVINLIKPHVTQILISANRNIETYKNYSTTVLADDNEEFGGPLHGIQTLLPYCVNDRVLIVPCDMPKLPDQLVGQLITHFNNTISIATVNNKLQLAMLIHRNLLPTIKQYLHNNETSLMKWVQQNDPVLVNFDDFTSCFVNINSQLDLDNFDST